LITLKYFKLKLKLKNFIEISKEHYSIYFIYMEFIQNIMNYSINTNEKSNLGTGICFITYDKTNEKFIIYSGNIISINNIETLSNKIDKINSLDSDELKKYYKDLRKSGEDKHDKGSGLGLIEIAKKSKNKLLYKYTNIDTITSYFELTIHIDKSN